MIISPGTTDQSVRFTAFDDAGDPVILTAASAGLAIAYRRLLKGIQIGSTALASITDLGLIIAPHSDGGLLHFSDGEHRIDLPDAAFASGADEVRIYVVADAITGGVVHGPIWLQAERASQASVDALAADVAGLAGTTLTVVSPVGTDGSVEAYRARDYADADGLAFEWTNSAGTWPDLTGATIVVRLGNPGCSTVALREFTAAAPVPSGAGQTVRLELTDADLTIRADDYVYNVVATLASGRIVQLYAGTWSVLFALEAPA